MAKEKEKKAGNSKKHILEHSAKVFRQAATAIGQQKDVASQFKTLGNELSNLGPFIEEIESNATSSWTDAVAKQCGIIVDRFEKFEDGNQLDDEDTMLLIDGLAGAFDTIHLLLVQAASGFSTCGNSDIPLEVEQQIDSLVKQFNEVAFEFFVHATSLRGLVGVGINDSYSEFRYARRPRCGCNESGNDRAAIAPILPEYDSTDVFAGINFDILLENMAKTQGLSKLFSSLLIATASVFEALAIMAFFGCAAQCNGAHGTLLPGPNPTKAKITARKVGVRTYQPEMDIVWDYCCWNGCWFFWWNKLIVSAKITQKLGGTISLGVGKPIGSALRAAQTRAAAFNLAGIPPAPFPNC